MSTAEFTYKAQTTIRQSGSDWNTPSKMTYSVDVSVSRDDDGFVATIPRLPGAVGEGDTIGEAVKDVTAAFIELVHSYRESALDIPWCEACTGEEEATRVKILIHV